MDQNDEASDDRRDSEMSKHGGIDEPTDPGSQNGPPTLNPRSNSHQYIL